MPGSPSILDRATATQIDNLTKLAEKLNEQSKRLNCITTIMLFLTLILSIGTIVDIVTRLNN